MTALKLLRSYDEADNIRTFVFETAGASWQPGQYQTYELENVRGDDGANQRYFTIASAPCEEEIHISTRITDSAFKQALVALEPGETIDARDIAGDFVWDNDEPVVLVAGGIGVTPYRSMLVERAAAGQSIPAHLLYFGRNEAFAFRQELDAIAAQHPELTIDYIVGETISNDTIFSHAPEAGQRVVYLSGPEPMVDAVGEALIAQGVTLKQDWFPGYTDQTY